MGLVVQAFNNQLLTGQPACSWLLFIGYKCL